MIYSKLIITELGRFPTRSDNVYFANNKQAALAVFTFTFYFALAEHNLIKVNLYINWSAQAVNSISERAKWSSSKLIKFAHLSKLANQSRLNKPLVTEKAQACTVAFINARNLLAARCWDKFINCRKNRRW